MDSIKILPSKLSGTVNIPPSKSFAHRAVLAAFLSGGGCTVNNIKLSNDIQATLNCVKTLGADWEYDNNSAAVIFKRHSLKKFPQKLCFNCGESGSTLRFLIPVALCFSEKVEFYGHGRLMQRPLVPYFDMFDKNGISYKIQGSKLELTGKLTPGKYIIDGSVSSQFITGLLFALPCLKGDSQILINGNLASRGYVDITLDVLKTFGVEVLNNDYKEFLIKGNCKYISKNYTVEGDFSQAAFFLAAGALGCDILCNGLNPDSLQGDKKILDIIKNTGATVRTIGHSSFKAVSANDMHSITVDVNEIPDLVPILAVLMTACNGESRIVNAARLREKESDRLSAICTELKTLGADISEGKDYLVINGTPHLSGGTVSSHNDHRIAMACAIAAYRCNSEVTITGANESVKKSYPGFFDDYMKLGGKAK